MLTFIEKRQAVHDCGAGPVAIAIGDGGGFGSKFQYIATKLLMVLISGHGVAIPIGEIGPYTSHPDCMSRRNQDTDQSGFSCYFEPMAPPDCSVTRTPIARLIGTHCPAGEGGLRLLKESVHTAMRNETFSRPQNSTKKWRDAFDLGVFFGTAAVDTNMAFPPILPEGVGPPEEDDIGRWWGAVHGYLFRPNTYLQKVLSTAAAKLKLTSATIDIGLHIRLGDKKADTASRQKNVKADPEHYLAEAEYYLKKLQNERPHLKRPIVIYVATDERRGAAAAKVWAYKWNANVSAGKPRVRVVMQHTYTQEVSGKHIEMARRLNSFNTTTQAAESEAVLIDVFFLSEARFFVGIVMSQFARTAVSIGVAKGTMEEAVGLDRQNLLHGDDVSLGQLPSNTNAGVKSRPNRPFIAPHLDLK